MRGGALVVLLHAALGSVLAQAPAGAPAGRAAVGAPRGEERVRGLGGRLALAPDGRVAAVLLRGTWVTDSDLDLVAGWKEVARIDLSHTRITDQGLLRLRPLEHVRTLELYYAELITDEGMAAAREWRRLERVNLCGTDTTLALLASLPALTAVDVGYAQVTDSGLQHLGRISGLRELAFGGNKLTEQALQVLYSLPALRRLDVSGRQRTDSGLWFASVTDFGVDPIASLRELVELDLAGTQVTSRALEKLAPLGKLEKLDLHGARRVGDEAVERLLAFPRLRWVDLDDTGITQSGIERLRKARPAATILWN
jgi:hypothetical protein